MSRRPAVPVFVSATRLDAELQRLGAVQRHAVFCWPLRRPYRRHARRGQLLVYQLGQNDAGQKNNWEDHVVQDVVNHVDWNFRTIARREGRSIAGLSMGGNGA